MTLCNDTGIKPRIKRSKPIVLLIDVGSCQQLMLSRSIWLIGVRTAPFAESRSMRPYFVASLRPNSLGDIVEQVHRCDHVSGAQEQETQFQSAWYKSGLLFCRVVSSRSSSRKSFEAQVKERFCAKDVCCGDNNMLCCKQNNVQFQLIPLESCSERREVNLISEMSCSK